MAYHPYVLHDQIILKMSLNAIFDIKVIDEIGWMLGLAEVFSRHEKNRK